MIIGDGNIDSNVPIFVLISFIYHHACINKKKHSELTIIVTSVLQNIMKNNFQKTL